MTMKNLPFIILTLVLISCGHKQKSNTNNTISIRDTSLTDDLELKTIQLLKLQPNTFAQISSIDKVVFTTDRIFILDKTIGNAIFIFDFEGSFVNYIYRVGEGPGEYGEIENVFWNSFTNELILIPMDYKKKIFFDRNGNFLNEEFYTQEIVYADLVFLENGELFVNYSSLNAESNVALYQDGLQKMAAFPFDPLMDDNPLNYRSIISKVDDSNYLLTLGLRDTLYSLNIEDYQIHPKYFLDFGNELSFEDFNTQPNPLKYFMENDIYVGVMDLFQTKDFVSFTTLNFEGLHGRIYSKSAGKSYSTQELIEQKLGQLGFEGVLGITVKNEFVAVLSSGESGKWDFSLNPSLEKQFADFGQVDKEELILMIFDLEEDK
ncbi:6-bladed beta-propeller [Algoriphagus aquimarinus]|uniref:6-bladed beta-propeller n=1 Tax=Algoriphagus aquimarinus TaxID=237018 RepID=A0A5C7AMC6_9BACT|nr:6-bladed beta-propeller [Algoriphagus aquimarinus]TXE08919.1 6-bladed beta-propeller [Algoriphagus aquimarinus]